ncbi:MAG: helix-turn-helix domain containing protein, partial [Proteobacteria bacterium]|nr:helix-turn-helix domain containing protein [Pseudomonadota bacterium]
MNSTQAAQVTRRNNPEGARTSLLDAAEKLFAGQGYAGVSVRDVVAEAGLKLGMLTYHFGTKEELFRQVIGRRAEEYVGLTERSLAAALANAGDIPPTAEAIIRAYAAPALHLSMRGGGWKNYMKLL